MIIKSPFVLRNWQQCCFGILRSVRGRTPGHTYRVRGQRCRLQDVRLYQYKSGQRRILYQGLFKDTPVLRIRIMFGLRVRIFFNWSDPENIREHDPAILNINIYIN